ncbi:MAG: asparagine synthase-related protein [Saprospiraceae bacterium]|nr:asparagine synthase-related protein [Saprospiraceae bacterium]MDW8229304.1 asparagine synthase-related protein [Saprospiraceae bacterium]
MEEPITYEELAMFAYLHYRCQPDAPLVRVAMLSSPTLQAPSPQTLYLYAGAQQIDVLDLPDGSHLYLLGDPVFGDRQRAAGRVSDWHSGALYPRALYTEVRGHYYWFLLKDGLFRCGTSFGGIYPLYWQKDGNQIYVCTSSFYLARRHKPGELNRRNLLERLLFNYSLFNSTWWTNIRLLGSHCWLTMSEEGAREERAFGLENYFGHGFLSGPDVLDELTEVFERESRVFLPPEPFAISFTGGFDGRTLVAAARQAHRDDFLTYSFGMPGESDVALPARQSEQLGIPFLPIYLDETYVREHALRSAIGFMQRSEYNGNFGRPHYFYAAETLAKHTRYILTGNFGSELFRAMHQPGVMMTQALIQVFETPDDSWKDFLRKAAGRQVAAYFRTELDALISDFEHFLRARADMDINQQFYCFVLEEIFRKYFGPELVMQSHVLCNRTPYLSLRFFEALNKTVWSGLHARLFDKQKNRRMKGQMFYSAFLRRTDRQLYRMLTNKGYSPADVLERWRRPLLAARVAYHKFFRKEMGDSNAVETYFRRYQHDLLNYIRPEDHRELLQSGIAYLMESGLSRNAVSLSELIHLYSVAAGWTAAAHPVQPLEPSLIA